MGTSDDDTEAVSTASAEALPDLNPWREAGWIFGRDGDCVAIARHAVDEPRAQILPDEGRQGRLGQQGRLMVKVTHLADDGTEMAVVDLDDFTVEVVYSGLAEMLHDAAATHQAAAVPACELSREARQRRQRVLSRIRD